jgi:hypothetical protein
MRLVGFSYHEKGAPRQEISRWSTVCNTFSRSGWSVVRDASVTKGGTSKKRPSPHLHKVPTRSNKVSPRTLPTALIFPYSCAFNWAPRHEGVLRQWRYGSTHSLASEPDRGEWSVSCPGRFTPKERATGTHWIGGWVGPRAGLDAVVDRNIPIPRRESSPRTPIVQPVAQSLYRLSYHALKFISKSPKHSGSSAPLPLHLRQ